MTTEQFERERQFRVAMSVVRSMLRQGVIDRDDFTEMRRLLIEKYKPFFGGLTVENR